MTGRIGPPYAIDDAERVLKNELAELHVMFHRHAEPILRQLGRLEAMKPPRPIWIDAGMLSQEMQTQLASAPVDLTKQSLPDRVACLEHERAQLLHLLRMMRSAAGESLPSSLRMLVDRELGNS